MYSPNPGFRSCGIPLSFPPRSWEGRPPSPRSRQSRNPAARVIRVNKNTKSTAARVFFFFNKRDVSDPIILFISPRNRCRCVLRAQALKTMSLCVTCTSPTHSAGPNVAKSQSPRNSRYFSSVSHLVKPERFVSSRSGRAQGPIRTHSRQIW